MKICSLFYIHSEGDTHVTWPTVHWPVLVNDPAYTGSNWEIIGQLVEYLVSTGVSTTERTWRHFKTYSYVKKVNWVENIREE